MSLLKCYDAYMEWSGWVHPDEDCYVLILYIVIVVADQVSLFV